MEPIVAALLSALVVGLGQIILGQTMKGIAMLVGAIVIGFITLGAGACVIWVLSGVDAYLIAQKLREGKSVGEWEFF